MINNSKATISEIAIQTILRFPLIILCSLIGSLAIILFEGYDRYGENTDDIFYLMRITWACALGIPFLFSLNIIGQNIRNPIINVFVRLFGILIIFFVYLIIPKTAEEWNIFFNTKIIAILTILLMVCTFLPFWKKKDSISFWEYNKSLFINSIFSILYCTVFFVGVSVALYFIDKIFLLGIPEIRYTQIGIAIFGILGIWYFLSLLPYEYQQIEGFFMPKGLVRFNQFVLIPLLFIYGFILYWVALKIVLDWKLPKNQISLLILIFSIIGILAFFFIFPLREKKSKIGLRLFGNTFFIVLLPLLALHFVVLARRITDYGFTENRYFGLLLGLWLFGLSIYFITNKKGRLICIPMSLCAVILFGIFFPFLNAFSVTERDQVNELYTILNEEKALINDTLPEKIILPNEKAQRIKDIIFYLERRNQLQTVKPLFANKFDSLENQGLLNAYQLGKIFKDSSFVDKKIIRFYSDYNYIDVHSFEHFFPFSAPGAQTNNLKQEGDYLKKVFFNIGDKEIMVNLESFSDSLINHYFNKYYQLNEAHQKSSSTIDFALEYDQRLDSIVLEYKDEDRQAKIYFRDIAYKIDEKIDIIGASGFIFVKKPTIDTLQTLSNTIKK